MAFENYVAPEPSLNATIKQGRKVIALYARAGFTNPRLFINPTFPGGQSGGGMIPEKSQPSDGDNSMIDTGQEFGTMGIPEDLPIYLAFSMDEMNRTFAGVSTFFLVAEAVKEMNDPDPVHGLTGLMSLTPPGTAVDAKVLAIIANIPAAVAAIGADLKV